MSDPLFPRRHFPRSNNLDEPRVCRYCGDTKLLREFHAVAAGGRSQMCKQCHVERQKLYSHNPPPQDPTSMHACRKCGETKVLTEFTKRTDGRYSSPCKACVNKKSKQWVEQNRERSRANHRAYTERHPDKDRASKEKWRKSERGRAKFRTSVNRRRDIIAASGDNFTDADVARILSLQGRKCANTFCRRDISNGRYHIDHIVALSVSHDNSSRNIQLLCPECNWRKNDKPEAVWLEEESRRGRHSSACCLMP